MDPHFGGVNWTNHAIARMHERGIKQGDAWATWRNPEQSRKGKLPGVWIYYRTYGSEKIEVVAEQDERKRWVIISVWSRPIYSKNGSKPASFWIKFIRSIFGF